MGPDQLRAPRDGHQAPPVRPQRGHPGHGASDLVAETLGEHVFDFFLRNKREEWQEYRRQVSRYELDRYLPIL